MAQPATILVVDDSDVFRSLVVGALATHGHSVVEAIDMATAEAAHRALEAEGRRLDLLLCDIVLEGPSGLEVARSFIERQPDLPVVFMSGASVDRAELTPPRVTVLAKPFRLTELRERVAEALSVGGTEGGHQE